MSHYVSSSGSLNPFKNLIRTELNRPVTVQCTSFDYYNVSWNNKKQIVCFESHSTGVCINTTIKKQTNKKKTFWQVKALYRVKQ